MSARVYIPQVAMDSIDGERRANRAIRAITDGMALSPDFLLHELQDVFESDGEFPNATARARAFMRAIMKRLEDL
jgi:hypothetical protein